MKDATRKIVVVGGGLVGLKVIRHLERKLGPQAVVLIEPREYTEVPIAVLRGLMDPDGFGATIRKRIDQVTNVRHIRARARAIEDDTIVLHDGSRVPFSYAVVATGSITKGYRVIKGGGALTLAERTAEFRAEAERIRNAGSILIIGGGPVGVELASEIAHAYPGKKVTLADRQERLLPALPPAAGRKARRMLSRLDVEVVLGEVLEPGPSGFADSGGRRFAADLVISAIGIETTAIPVLGIAAIDRKGQLRVDRHLRVHGRENVFGAGDVNDVPEIKLAATGKLQARVVAANILALRRDPAARLRAYRPWGPLGFVTVGPERGIVQLPFGRMDPLIAAKQKDLFVSSFLEGVDARRKCG
jgi:NADH dehydrogenase FAD-containing subunit